MTARLPRSRRLSRVCCGLAIASTLVGSACAAGQHAQTADQKPTLDGTEASVGQLDLRGIAIAAPPSGVSYAPGTSAQLHLVVANNGQSPDQLTSITSSAITAWGSYSSPAAAQAAQEPSPSSTAPSTTAAPSTPTPAASTSGSSSGSKSPARSGKSSSSSASTSAAPSTTAAPTSTLPPPPTPSRSVAIPAGSATSWGVPNSQLTLVLSGIRQRLFPAAAVRLTFTFAKAGKVTVPVPVELTGKIGSSYVPEPANPSGSATA
ncbi:hypothetical protein [uncultured Jatrophihabitans sp.]|uniref:hypothetical protein n=1 Tax=uncultured Jatrophihabitans sp. TaxID=1610747 RepID=UPI0035CC95F9